MASKLDRARANMSRLRSRVRNGDIMSAGSAVSTGAAVGALEDAGIMPVAILGGKIPLKPIIGVGLLALSSQASIGSAWHSILTGAGDGVMGAYGYAAGKEGDFIAGGMQL